MEAKQDVELEVLKDKKVQVKIITSYIVDGEVIGSKNFRFCLDVGDYIKAQEYLDGYWINVLQSIWTSEIVSAYSND